jgi:catechol 2,3-dioxygenase-like lactoylglutathione lyase family enzyme
MPTRAIAFIATTKSDLAIPFFRDVLGFTFVEDSPFAVEFDAFGTALRVQKVKELSPAPHTSFGLAVDDIARFVSELSEKGVSMVRYPHVEQDPLGIWTSPSGARVAWFHDPDGNVISLTQYR